MYTSPIERKRLFEAEYKEWPQQIDLTKAEPVERHFLGEGDVVHFSQPHREDEETSHSGGSKRFGPAYVVELSGDKEGDSE